VKKISILLALALTLVIGVGSAHASKLDEVKKRGVLVAGVKDATPPFGFIDESKQLVGFEIDLLKAIAAKLGVKLELKPVTSSTRIPLLTQGSVDIVAPQQR